MLDKIAQLKAQIKLAETMLRLDAVNKELAKYNVRSLQKSAAFGRDKTTRLKVAALIRQRELEKKAFAGAIGAMGRSVGQAAQGVSDYFQQRGLSGAVRDAGQGVSNMANSAADGIEAVGKLPGQMYRKGQQMYHNVMSPVRNVAAGVQGFGQGMYQGAKSMASLPGALANTTYQGFTGGLANQGPVKSGMAGAMGAAAAGGGGLSGMQGGLNNFTQSALGKLPQQQAQSGFQLPADVLKRLGSMTQNMAGTNFAGQKAMGKMPNTNLPKELLQRLGKPVGNAVGMGSAMPSMPKMPAPSQPKPPSVLTGGF